MTSPPTTPPRRTFLLRVVQGSALIQASAALGATGAVLAPAAAGAQQQSGPAAYAAAGYAFFGPAEAAFVEAMVNTMCPADGLTPSGVDCGLATYIDRQLAGAFGRGDRLYMEGPYLEGVPQLGYQLPMTPAEFARAGIAAADRACSSSSGGKSFAQLAPAQAEAMLQDIAAGRLTEPRLPLAQWFNELMYPLFTEACFADPLYGGNRDMVFWKLIGYPGLPGYHAQDMVTFRGKPYPGARTPHSIADFS